MAKTAIALVLTMGLLALPLSEAVAHGGGLNRDGCHNETATGGYHCHRDDNDTQESNDTQEDLETAGLVIGGLLVLAITLRYLSDDAQALHRLQIYSNGNRSDLIYSLNASQQIGVRTLTDDAGETYLGTFWRLTF